MLTSEQLSASFGDAVNKFCGQDEDRKTRVLVEKFFGQGEVIQSGHLNIYECGLDRLSLRETEEVESLSCIPRTPMPEEGSAWREEEATPLVMTRRALSASWIKVIVTGWTPVAL